MTLFSFSIVLPLLVAQGSGVLSIGAAPRAGGKRNGALEARVPVQLRAGYHVNSNTPPDDYLIPLRLTWEASPLQAVETIYPRPEMRKYAFSSKPLSVYTGDFEIVARFKVPASAPAGPGVLAGRLRYQACNDRMCLPPKTVEVRVPYSIQ